MRYSLIVGFALTVFALSSFAQQGGCYLAVKNTQLFLKTKTIVLLSGDKAYNEAITKAFNEHWKVTPTHLLLIVICRNIFQL